MADSYSVYEAKAKLSEILRRVREGQTITISYHGKPVAEVRPVAVTGDPEAARRQALIASGELVPARRPYVSIKPLARRPGALKRFLDDRTRF